MKQKPIIVVGAGLSGLFTTLCLVISGQKVILIDSFKDLKGGYATDSDGFVLPLDCEVNPTETVDQELIRMSDFLVDQYLAEDFLKSLPHLFQLLRRLGVAFDFRESGIFFESQTQHAHHKLCHSGFLTRQAIVKKMRALVLQYIREGKVRFFGGYEFIEPIIDSKGQCRGALAINRATMVSDPIPGSCLVVCTGGFEGLFEKSSQHASLGSVLGALYKNGAALANPEMIQYEVCFKTLQGELPAAALVEQLGGRYWVKRDGSPWYFLEDLYPQFKNDIPQLVVCRAVLKLKEKGYKDFFVSLPESHPLFALPSWRDFKKFIVSILGDNLDLKSIPIDLLVADTLGGLWVNQNFETSIPGVLAAGGSQYHLKGASLLSAYKIAVSLYAAFKAAARAIDVSNKMNLSSDDVPSFLFDDAVKNNFRHNRDVMDLRGGENIYRLLDELKMILSRDAGLVRDNRSLLSLADKIREIKFRLKEVLIKDRSAVLNEELLLYLKMESIIPLAEAFVRASQLRDESRGCFFKPLFPERNDMLYLKSSRVRYVAEAPKVEYEDIAKTSMAPFSAKEDDLLFFGKQRAS